jgi:hypothetical protein
MRVQIPAYTDRWMVGDRYGEIVKTYKRRRNFPVDSRRYVSADAKSTYIAYHTVKLDKSGKTVVVLADDCTEVT